MSDEEKTMRKSYVKYVNKGGGSSGAAYILAMIGAAVYYLQQASGLGEGVVALLKALVWPAFLVYNVLHFLR